MKMKATKILSKVLVLITVALFFAGGASHASESDSQQPLLAPMAMLDFQERGSPVSGYGEKVTDLLFAELVMNPHLYLVNRSEMQSLLDEFELNLSGMVTPDRAVQVGHLTGARLLLTGSVFEVGDNLYLVARIIGTETSRVLGASVKGLHRNGLEALAPELAREISTVVEEKADELLPPPADPVDVVAKLREKLADREELPVIWVSIEEEHIGRPIIDPAVQTEFIKIAQAAGFEVFDPDRRPRNHEVDIMITGEGFSEFAARRGNLVSVKARVEVKAIRSGESNVLAADRQTAIKLGLAENIAAKAALQEAGARLAERLLPKLAE